ncbi:MAG: NUDIX hydrolase, partial [Candidatus Paceibacterota bacterium]
NQFVATRAFIVNEEGKVLIIREASEYSGGTQVGKYDLPGGKIKPGESAVEATKREVKEEVGLDVEIGQPFFVSEWYPEIKGETIQIVGIFFKCTPASSVIILSVDHDDFQWIDPADHSQYECMKENIGAFDAHLKNRYR